jgi:putative two-component system response regulator
METLLVVEDNRPMRLGLRDILEQAGFVVLTAADGSEALAQMSQTRPDLILSDIAMPVMDGFAFFQEVRAKPEWVSIPFIFLTARGEREDIMRGKELGADDYLTKPFTPDELLTAVRARLDRTNQLQLIQLHHAYQASLTVLANAIEVRDQYTRGHVERVAAYAAAVARHLGWSRTQLESLHYGGILHDIGKIGIRENTLRKAGPLDPDEWDEIKRHPLIGAEMLKDIHYLEAAIPIIRFHHERWDGQGYPDGLSGEAIPLEARIVAVADSFDAMTTTRCYRPRNSLLEAFEQILAGSGNRYDPAIVAAFQAAWSANEIQLIAASSAPLLEDNSTAL